MSSKRKWLKKLLVVSLSAAIIGGAGAVAPISITGSALTASAAETTDTEIPSGYTAVYDIADLYNIRSNPKGKYILMNDIDLSATAPGGDWDCGTGWETIVSFSGVLDGNGHTLSDLYLNGSRFIRDNKGTVKNLNIRSMYVRGNFIYENTGTVSNINVKSNKYIEYNSNDSFIYCNKNVVKQVHIVSKVPDKGSLCCTNYSRISYCSVINKGSTWGSTMVYEMMPGSAIDHSFFSGESKVKFQRNLKEFMIPFIIGWNLQNENTT